MISPKMLMKAGEAAIVAVMSYVIMVVMFKVEDPILLLIGYAAISTILSELLPW